LVDLGHWSLSELVAEGNRLLLDRGLDSHHWLVSLFEVDSLLVEEGGHLLEGVVRVLGSLVVVSEQGFFLVVNGLAEGVVEGVLLGLLGGQELVQVNGLLESWFGTHGLELGLDGGNLDLSGLLVLDEMLGNLDSHLA
jgi:hypothetical protein